MRYEDVRSFTEAGLTSKGYGKTGPAMPMFHPGPPTIAKLQNLSPGTMVFTTVGNGAGLMFEGLYERKFIVVRAIGPQGDYAAAESLALDIDGLYLPVESAKVGTARVLYITRNAAPQLVDLDDAERYHFQCTYIAETMT